MAKNDVGYTKSKASRSSRGGGGGGRGMSMNTWLARTPKASVKQYLINEMTNERLEAMGDIPPQSELGLSIRQSVTEEVKGEKNLKQDIADRWDAKRGSNPLRLNKKKVTKLAEAEILTEALYSFTKSKERENLDEGEFLDDPATAVIDGSGWGEEVLGRQEYRKHINICVDNSGSTHTIATGFCSKVLQEVSRSLIGILDTASQQYEGITWGVYNFNKVARCELFYGKDFVDEYRWFSDFYGTYFLIADPLQENASETRLAPLMEEIYEQESKNGLLGEPRLDIILTDGEFENQQDADKAIEIQNRRGGNVYTYILNVAPEIPSDIELPPQFRVIPVKSVSESDGVKQGVDTESLRNVLYSIVIDEMTKGS